MKIPPISFQHISSRAPQGPHLQAIAQHLISKELVITLQSLINLYK